MTDGASPLDGEHDFAVAGRSRVLVPSWEGQFVRLRPVSPDDYGFIYQMSIAPSTGFRWRYRGATPDPAKFRDSLWDNLLVQLIVENIHDGSRLGVVTAYDANLRDGWVYIGALGSPEYIRSGLIFEGALLLIDYLFIDFPVRKLYIESAEYNYFQYGKGEGHIFHEEARLRDHIFHGGRYWDLAILVITRSEWESNRDEWRRLNLRNSSDLTEFLEPEAYLSLQLDEFVEVVRQKLFPDREDLHAEEKLREDLDMDSLDILELMALIDELAGGVELDTLSDVHDLRDVYAQYCTAISLPQKPREPGTNP